METQNIYEGITHTIQISSNYTQHCSECNKTFGGDTTDVSSGINHYMQEHNYTLLHIGHESARDNDGKTYQHTTAILGC